tara:strand:+ start:55 stop:921 length:867 start_codon:yes stop_codon:yes gene_type:complete
MGCVFPFKQHKDNPTQIPIGTPYAFMSASVKLGSLPKKLYNPAKGIFLETKVKRKLNKYIKNNEGPVDAGDISTLSDNIQSNFSNIGDLITSMEYVAGISFGIGGCSKADADEYRKKNTINPKKSDSEIIISPEDGKIYHNSNGEENGYGRKGKEAVIVEFEDKSKLTSKELKSLQNITNYSYPSNDNKNALAKEFLNEIDDDKLEKVYDLITDHPTKGLNRLDKIADKYGFDDIDSNDFEARIWTKKMVRYLPVDAVSGIDLLPTDDLPDAEATIDELGLVIPLSAY